MFLFLRCWQIENLHKIFKMELNGSNLRFSLDVDELICGLRSLDLLHRLIRTSVDKINTAIC